MTPPPSTRDSGPPEGGRHVRLPPARPFVIFRQETHAGGNGQPAGAGRDEHHEPEPDQQESARDSHDFHDGAPSGTASTGTRASRSTRSAVEPSRMRATLPVPR